MERKPSAITIHPLSFLTRAGLSWLGGWGLILMLVLAMDARSYAASLTCQNDRLSVNYEDPQDARSACLGAGDAMLFLAGFGLRLDRSLTIDIVARIDNQDIGEMYACFNRSNFRITILAYDACDGFRGDGFRGDGFQNSRKLFGIPMTRDLYRSIIAHEVAHAIAAVNFGYDDPNWPVQEYIAYVTQIATLPVPLREQVLAANPGDGFANIMQINSMILMLKPAHFAAESYRHFQRPENGRLFLADLISGKIRLIFDLP